MIFSLKCQIKLSIQKTLEVRRERASIIGFLHQNPFDMAILLLLLFYVITGYDTLHGKKEKNLTIDGIDYMQSKRSKSSNSHRSRWQILIGNLSNFLFLSPFFCLPFVVAQVVGIPKVRSWFFIIFEQGGFRI